MTETKKATCATCPWWEKPDGYGETTYIGACRNARGTEQPSIPEPGTDGDDWWCSEHPDRKLPDPMLHRIAAALEMLVGRTPTRRERVADAVLAAIADSAPHPDETEYRAGHAYDYADAMLAEAKRRRGE